METFINYAATIIVSVIPVLVLIVVMVACLVWWGDLIGGRIWLMVMGMVIVLSFASAAGLGWVMMVNAPDGYLSQHFPILEEPYDSPCD